MKLFPHQERFVKQNPDKAILAWEMRVGKSLPASIWIDLKKQAGSTYIITPKQNKKDWERMGTKATVLSKEEFKKTAHTIKNPTAIVYDEVHTAASPAFLKTRSQLTSTLYNLLKEYPECKFLGLTGTPIRQDAWSLHTLLCYIGVYYDWKAWRSKFFELQYLPFLTRPAWFPKKTWRTDIRPYLEKHCDIVSLRDVVDNLPPIEKTVIEIKQPKYIYPEDRVVTWYDEHLHEQTNKHKEILELDYRKMILIVHYTDQIDALKRHLEKDRPVYVLDGRTKNPDETKRMAQEADDCFFIVQSSMGFGWDGWMFSAIVFVSMSHSCLNHTQALGRLRHQEHLHTIPAYYLVGGKWDKRIMETIEKGKNFNPHEYKFAGTTESE